MVAIPKQLIGQADKSAGKSAGLSVSPDARYIVFSSRRSGDFDIWRTDIDGGNPKQLTGGDDGSKFLPSFSPDGKWIVYTVLSNSGPSVWKVPTDGGDAVQVFETFARAHAVSPDGKLIACSYRDDQLSSVGFRMGVIPLKGASRQSHLTSGSHPLVSGAPLRLWIRCDGRLTDAH